MEYIHINKKEVSAEDKRNGKTITIRNKVYKIIGYEFATNNFICVEI